ncbi:MAG: hypothetical protein AAFW00_10310 [Bacteroidota bacterium]
MHKPSHLILSFIFLFCIPIFSYAQYGAGVFRAQWAGYKGVFFEPTYNLEMTLQMTAPQDADRMGFSFSFASLSPRQDVFTVVERDNFDVEVLNTVITRFGQVSLGAFIDHKFIPRLKDKWLQPTYGIESHFLIYSTTYSFARPQDRTPRRPRTQEGTAFETGFRLGMAITLIKEKLYIYTGLGRNFGTMTQIREGYTLTGENGPQPYTYWKPYFTLQHFF